MASLKLLYLLSILCSIAVAVLTPFAVWAVIHLPIGSADVHEWLPEGRSERMRYEAFTQQFGSDQVVIISWEDARIDDPRMRRMEQTLDELATFSKYFLSYSSPRKIVEQLRSEPLRLSREESIDRLSGVLIGAHGNAAMALVVSPYGVAHHAETIEWLRSAADAVPGLGRDRLRLVGTVYEAYAVDVAAEASLKQLVLPSTLLGLLACWFCIRTLRGMIVVMLLSGVGQLLMIAIVYYTGTQFSAVLIVLPTLVFMLTLSGAVHLMNYRSAPPLPSDMTPGMTALRIGWKPCILSSGTTVLGMGSLVTSQLVPVRQFGIYSAIGLTLATAVLLLVFPFLSDCICGRRFAPRRKVHGAIDASPSSDASILTASQPASSIWIRLYAQWIGRHALSIVGMSTLLLLVTCAGLYQLRSSTKFCDMFSPSHPTHENMVWFEEEIGPIATVEVLMRYRRQDSKDLLNEIRDLSVVSERLRKNPDVGGVFCATAFLPAIPEGRSVGATTQRSVLRKRIAENSDSLVSQGLLFQDEEVRVWRVMTKVSAVSNESYGALTDSVRATVMETLQAQSDSHSSVDVEPEVSFTGLSPVMHDTQITLLTDLGNSFLSAFLLITPVLMIIVRSFVGGLLVMLPNVLPVTIAFGGMGAMHWSLDIAGILTASIALGIAVDDTLHFVCWYSDEVQAGYSRASAVERTFEGCTRAMIHTSLISCGSMLPFLFAGFVPTQQFAKLMIVMLSLALVGDLVLLPAILLSPLGIWIARARQRSPKVVLHLNLDGVDT